MDDKDSARNDRRKLKALLDANQYVGARFGERGYDLPFSGRLRDWHVRCHLRNNWLALTTFVMAVPEAESLRAKLACRMLELNDTMSVAKFTKSGETLTLDLEYREEHLDPGVFHNLVGLLHSLAEEHYPELFRIAAGDATLATLEHAFERSSLRAGTE